MTYKQVFKQKEEMDNLFLDMRNIYKLIGILEKFDYAKDKNFDINALYSSICAGDNADEDIEYRDVLRDYFVIMDTFEHIVDHMWDEEVPNK